MPLQRRNDSIILAVRSEDGMAECPLCGARSRRIHSRYDRQVADLPCAGKQIRLRVITRRFICEIRHCRRRIFAERFGDDVLPTRSRRTARLECIVHHLGLALGGRPAARFAKRLMLPVSNDTLLRVVRRRTRPRTEPLIVAGIDDWAFRKNHRYGTIVCDLERRRIVTLLPDREIATVRAWLSDHPEIMVVSRDRGGGYGEAAAKALPDAVQVADRWHLMENASAAFLNAVRRSMRVIRTAIGATTINPKLLTCAERLQYEGYLRRKQTNAAIMALVGDAVPLKEIVRRTGHSRKLVRQVSRGESTDVFRTRQSTLDATCPFWMRNGARAAVTAQSSGVVCKGNTATTGSSGVGRRYRIGSVSPMAGRISMGTRREITAAVVDRHRSAGRMDKGRILDELCAVTGWHRKHAVRALASHVGISPEARRQRSPTYGATITAHPTAEWIANQLTEACGWSKSLVT
jgi:transposase